ncbi:MAG: hypothetical protein ACR2NM_01820, partial [Bythopirellula sp.]
MQQVYRWVVLLTLSFVGLAQSCYAVDANQQIKLAESVVRQQQEISSSATAATSQIRNIHDAASAVAHQQALSAALSKLVRQVDKLNGVMKTSQQTLRAAPPESIDLAARWQGLLEETLSLRNQLVTHLAVLMQEIERLTALRSLPLEFWQQIRLDLAELELATFGTLEWMGRSTPPREYFSFLESKVRLLKKHGSAQVIDVKIQAELVPELKSIENELTTAAAGQPQIIRQPNPVPNSLVSLIIAPVTDFDNLASRISFGRVTDQDKSQGLLRLSARDSRTPPLAVPRATPQEIDAAVDRLTDGGTFFKSRQGLRHFNPRKTLERRGPDAMMTYELQGMKSAPQALDTLRAIWRNDDTGIPSYSESYGDMNIRRGALIYAKDIQSFADQVNYGTVVSVDEEKRRIVVKLDPDKLTPAAMLATLQSAQDVEAELAREKLAALTRGTTWEAERREQEKAEFDNKFAEKKARFAKEHERRVAEMESESEAKDRRSEASRKRNREEMRMAIETTGIDALREFLPEGEASSAAGRRRAGSSGLARVVAEFYPPKAENVPTLEEIQQLAFLLREDGSELEREAVVDALLKLRPSDVADKKKIGKIARGFKELALGEAFTEGAHVRGLAIWGGKHSLPFLVELMDNSTLEAPLELYAALVKLNDPRGAA